MIKFNISDNLPSADIVNNRFLLYSQCSGYELALGAFDEHGNFSHFLCSSGGEIVSVLLEDIEGWFRLDALPVLEVN